jgi:hypothetical protein
MPFLRLKPALTSANVRLSGLLALRNCSNYGPDDWIVNQAAANGINSTEAPIMALVGIFLDGNAPNTTAMLAAMDENGSWWDNTGQIQSTMMNDSPTLVK